MGEIYERAPVSQHEHSRSEERSGNYVNVDRSQWHADGSPPSLDPFLPRLDPFLPREEAA